MSQFFAAIATWSPVITGALVFIVAVATAAQTLFLALSTVWPKAKAIADECAVVALDVQGIAQWFAKLLTTVGAMKRKMMKRKPPPSAPIVGIILLTSCAAAQAIICTVSAALLPVLEGYASVCGPFAPACLVALETSYTAACNAAKDKGGTQQACEEAGRRAVETKAIELRIMRAQSDAQH